MSEEETTAAAIRAKAEANATAGIQSYSHGARQVSRSDPEKQLAVADRLELRYHRRLRGFCADCDQSGGVS